MSAIKNQPVDGEYPDNNPKQAIGEAKCPLHLVPPALTIGVAEAMADGARKYGAYNFRDSKIKCSVYTAAILRHLFAYMDGEENAKDSGVHHLKHAAACIALMLDSQSTGTFVDDRPAPGKSAELLEEYKDRLAGYQDEVETDEDVEDIFLPDFFDNRPSFIDFVVFPDGIALDRRS